MAGEKKSPDEEATEKVQRGLSSLVFASEYKTKKAEGRYFNVAHAKHYFEDACVLVADGASIDIREAIIPFLSGAFPEIKDLAKGTLNYYQEQAKETAIYPGRDTFEGLTYCALKLAGEAGEVAEKVGKIIRDDGSVVSDEKRQQLKKELGDVLWYIAMLADELGFSLQEVAEANQAKLASRKERGKLGGSGDDR